MKTRIAGLILIVLGALVLFPFIALLLGGSLMSSLWTLLMGLGYLVFGIFDIVIGSAIRGHKKWSWYVGIVVFGLGVISNLVWIFFGFSVYQIVALLLGGFIVYALISEKKLFFPSDNLVKAE